MHPIIGITLGEPKGIGPEVLAKALSIKEVHKLCVPVVFGPKESFLEAQNSLGFEKELVFIGIEDLKNSTFSRDTLAIFDISGDQLEESTIKAIRTCAELCMEGVLDAMVTGPVDKHRINKMFKGKIPFKGHTEYLAQITGAERVAMMLAGEKLRVVPVTTHCSIAEVPGLLTIKKIVDAIELTSLAMKQYYGIGEPRIGVAALNPHAGERGLLGGEEAKIILPAVEKCRLNGIEVSGPQPADTLFYAAVMLRKYDAVVTMYHDQALIPLKLLHFQNASNITLGLPIVRTSVDHGTAYGLVGKKSADPTSMVEAIRMATHLCRC